MSASRIITREELDRLLWGAADILRGTTDAADFKNHILSLLFLKRLNDVFLERRQEIIDEYVKSGKSEEQAVEFAEDPDEYGRGSYYIPPKA
ncbi:MAG TPA: type I restriction-modification system subunit M N-terminal domain-containing protein, partial [Planctomicrobium sp.]|nr:type I restriction-modification system subunit M N-terminal domain-containing protein [Planctomicrobium sp.]